MKNGSRVPGLTTARATVLDALSDQPDPVGIEALSEMLGRHPNTVREQLRWLDDHGLVRRHRVPGGGRGRPSFHYEAIGPVPGREDYAELAAALAWKLGQTDQAHDDSLAAGRAWGKQLCDDRDAQPAATAKAGREATVALLDELGYEPTADGRADRVDLHRCPLLQAAHQFPDVVCTVHLGLIQATLESYGADPARAELRPFAEPGRCALRLLT